MTSARVYRALLRLYPRSFRTAYGDDMAQVFGDCVREQGSRVWLRTVPDLVRTVPKQRIEALMKRNFALAFVVLTAVVVAVGVGRGAVVLILLVAVAAVVARQQHLFSALPAGERAPLRHAVTQAWWAPVAGFLGIATLLFGIGTIFEAHNWGGRIVGSTVLMAFGAAILFGLMRRPFDRQSGNTLVLLGTVPALTFFWIIVPTVLAIVVWIGVLSSGHSERPVAAA